jgi:PhnB protein
MANPVKPIPDGYHAITPSLTCRNAAAAIDFYKKAFGAQEVMRMPSPDGKIGHAELKIGDSTIMLNDEFPGMSAGPDPHAIPSTTLFLYVTDVDTTYKRAIEAGAKSVTPVQDMFWGDRYGNLTDPAGHRWGIATHKEDVAPDEMKRRAAAFMSKAAAATPQK